MAGSINVVTYVVHAYACVRGSYLDWRAVSVDRLRLKSTLPHRLGLLCASRGYLCLILPPLNGRGATQAEVKQGDGMQGMSYLALKGLKLV